MKVNTVILVMLLNGDDTFSDYHLAGHLVIYFSTFLSYSTLLLVLFHFMQQSSCSVMQIVVIYIVLLWSLEALCIAVRLEEMLMLRSSKKITMVQM